MAKTLRVLTRAGWVTKPVADTPANRLTAEEVDANFLAMEDAADAPFLGPGPQLLAAGDGDDGWFGEVSAANLFTGDELASILGVTEGVSQNSAAGWLKFASNGKVLFVAKQALRYSISWDHIYSRGLVYGTDDTGKAPRGTLVNQRTTVTVGGNEYIVRLLTGAESDPFPESDPLFFTADMVDMDVGGGSEWNDLIYRVHVDIPTSDGTDGMRADRHGGPQVGDNWTNYSDADLNVAVGNGRYTWCQEQSDTTSFYRVFRGNNDVAYFTRGNADNTHSLYGWRPVLELVTSGNP